jgi:hypothetical protein
MFDWLRNFFKPWPEYNRRALEAKNAGVTLPVPVERTIDSASRWVESKLVFPEHSSIGFGGYIPSYGGYRAESFRDTRMFMVYLRGINVNHYLVGPTVLPTNIDSASAVIADLTGFMPESVRDWINNAQLNIDDVTIEIGRQIFEDADIPLRITVRRVV